MTSVYNKLFSLVCKGDRKSLLRLLERHQVDLNTTDAHTGWTPLMHACDSEHFDIVRLLVESGADVNQQSSQGWSALHAAVDASIDTDCKHALGLRVDDAPVDIIVYLLWKGADLSATTTEGQTPIDFAEEVGASKILDLLKRYAKP